MNNLSLWEVKSYVRKAQNAVLNLSDIEAKVREATNNEPWGASNSLMAEIARGTFNYRDREEISNMIYRRFTEKSAHEWRQIYKSLQLMEYLVKNGSERFVDDARANISLVSMLKSFHYIDSKGVDQGINIRNRSKELVTLLNDESKIRSERKKAKENAKKFDAISSKSMNQRNFRTTSSSVNNRSQYGNRNSVVDTDADGYENRIFGDGGVFGQRFEESRRNDYENGSGNGNGTGNGSGNSSSNHFEEYQEDSHASAATSRKNSKPTVSESKVNANSDLLFDLMDAPVSQSNNNVANDDNDDDDFDDFQSATPAVPSNNGNSNYANLYNTTAPSPQVFSTTNTTTTTTGTTNNNDLFGSLLQSAKQTTHKQTPAQTQTPVQHSTSNNVVDLLDL